MPKRMLAVGVGMALLAGLAACGGGSGGSTAPTAVPAAPTKAVVTFNVDPNPVVSEYQGDGWWKFKVNLEFYDTAGVGFAINSVRTTLSSSVTGTILLDYDYSIAQHVDARGRTVLQFTSSDYHTLAGGGASVKFIANVTDDKGNPLTLSNQATVKHLDAPKVELPH
jgi:ABC-type glycerol-3-phosphate transport system substrate-binding protein